MKQTTRYALLAASVLAVAASAQAQYVNGDLLIGFTGGTSDFIYDLGPASTLTSGHQWTIGGNLGTQFGVIGALNSGSHIFATSSDPVNENGYDPTGNFSAARANITTIAGGLTLGNSRTPAPSDTTSWTYQTAQPPGTPGDSFQNNFFNPNVSSSSTAYLYNNLNIGTVIADGSFSYNAASGVVTYSAVPEPTSLGLLAGFGLLALLFRRHLANA
jgi:hypothetical protein